MNFIFIAEKNCIFALQKTIYDYGTGKTQSIGI